MQRIIEHPFLGYAFRPMFLGLGLFALIAIALWLAVLAGMANPTGRYGPLWHGHEMLFGFAMAAVAGFVLTAVANWTGRPPLRGMLLLVLAIAWLLGRVALASGNGGSAAGAGLAMAFPLLLTALVAREIVLGRSRRNYPIVAIVTLLAVLDGLYHLGAVRSMPELQQQALTAALYLMIVLITIIAGRIVPNFTANWLRARGDRRLPAAVGVVERLVLPATALTAVLAVVWPGHLATGLAAAVTSSLHGIRLSRWRGFATVTEPIVFVLHVAYAWLPLGFALLAASILGALVPDASVVHAFAVGTIGTMILAVTTRVALGHTGRPLHARPVIVMAYGAVTIAAVARIVSPFTGHAYLTVIEVAGFAWMLAWAVFSWVYLPILVGPRIDDDD